MRDVASWQPLGFGHGCHGLGAEYPFALKRALVQDHLTQNGQIVGGGEDPGIAGHPAQSIGRGVLHRAPAHIRGRDAIFQGRTGQKSGVAHAQRAKNLLGAIDVQGLARNPANDLAQGHKIGVAVTVTGTGTIYRLIFGNRNHAAIIAVPPGFRINVGPQTGGVGHQVPDGDPAFAVGAEDRPIFGHGAV